MTRIDQQTQAEQTGSEETQATEATETEAEGFDPYEWLGNAVPWDAIKWDNLLSDVFTLQSYGYSEYDAVRKVMSKFRRVFMERLSAEIKAQRSQAWKAATYERLRKEFEQEEKMFDEKAKQQ